MGGGIGFSILGAPFGEAEFLEDRGSILVFGSVIFIIFGRQVGSAQASADRFSNDDSCYVAAYYAE